MEQEMILCVSHRPLNLNQTAAMSGCVSVRWRSADE